MIGIIDYGVGNLFSLQASCKAIGQDVFVSGDGVELQKADRLILPGVGAFPDECIGKGSLGLETFRAIVNHPALRDKPMILETPNELPGYQEEIALLRSLES